MTPPHEKPALLYLPGLDGTGRTLFHQPDLDARFEVLRQTYPQDQIVEYDELAAQAARRIEDAGYRQVSVVAESFGGAVALLLAFSRPELVRRMLLVNTFAYFPARARIRFAAVFGKCFPNKPAHPATRPFRGWFFFAREIPRDLRRQWWRTTADVPLAAFARRIRMVAELDLRCRLAEVQSPCLVLAAPNDRVVPPSAGKELAKRLPHAKLLEPRVGHTALIHPAVNAAELLDEI